MKRQQLADNLPWGKSYFAKLIPGAILPLNEVKYCSPLIEVRTKNVYNKKNNGFHGFIIQCSNKQKLTMSKLNKKFVKVLKTIDKMIQFKKIWERSNKRNKNDRIAAIKLINKAVTFCWLSSIFSIRDLIRNQQCWLSELISQKNDPSQIKFDFQMEFDHNGNVITIPSFEDYTIHMMNLYDSIRKTVISDKSVEEFLIDISAISKNELNNKFEYTVNPLDYAKRKSFWKYEKDNLEKSIGSNIKNVNEYLFQFKSFSSINELLSETESNFQSTRKWQYDRLKQILSKVEKFHRSIEQIPNYPISIDWIMLNMPLFKQSISLIPSTILNNINDIMVKFLKSESQFLYKELMEYIQIFSTETTELTQYIEQSNAYRKLKNEFPTLERKVDNLESLASLFDTSTLSQIQVDNFVRPGYSEPAQGKSVMVSESILEVRKCLELLPELFLKVKQDLDKGRDNLATKVISTSKVLYDMIEKFEAAYIDNFHKRASSK